MDARLEQDLKWFFQVFQDRNQRILSLLPSPAQVQLKEELQLLEVSILNRVNEAFRV